MRLKVPDNEVYEHIQKVRYRAGLDVDSDLVSTWSSFSNNLNKPLTKNGMKHNSTRKNDRIGIRRSQILGY